MAVDFNGTTSKAEHTTATGFDNAQLTVCAWLNADDTGEGGQGRAFCFAENGGSPLLRFTAADTLRFTYIHSITSGGWTFPFVAGSWRPVSVTYDRGSTSNVPAVRVDFAAATVTTVATPDGTPTAPATGYCVGNVAGQTVTWNGGIAQVQAFDRILSTAEQDQALKTPGSVTSGLVLWLKLLDSTDNVDYSTAAQHPTFTSIADRTPEEPEYLVLSPVAGTGTGILATLLYARRLVLSPVAGISTGVAVLLKYARRLVLSLFAGISTGVVAILTHNTGALPSVPRGRRRRKRLYEVIDLAPREAVQEIAADDYLLGALGRFGVRQGGAVATPLYAHMRDGRLDVRSLQRDTQALRELVSMYSEHVRNSEDDDEYVLLH